MPEDARTGTVVAGCRIVETIGRGGMGVVYLAEQEALGRRVALKLLSRELAGDPAFRTRFQDEARIAASLDHPNVVPIHDAGEHDGELYIVMRWVPGGDLRGLLRDGPVTAERAAALTAQVAAALDAAHARGLVHRDVKAANVLLGDDGTAFLTDFGLTKAAAQTSGLTRTGQWLGTLDACAPEQIEGRRLDARTDVYALGCLLFQLLTGSVPFRRDHDAAKVWAHVHAPVPSPRELVPTLHPRWDPLFATALAKDPADRFASAGGLGRAAVALAAGRDPAADDRSVATGPAAPEPNDATTVVAPAPPRARDRRRSPSTRRPARRGRSSAGAAPAAAAPTARAVPTTGRRAASGRSRSLRWPSSRSRWPVEA